MDGSGRSPLFLATAYQHRRAVEYLIDNGADVNQTNTIGLSPFIMAVKRDDLSLVKLLIEFDCDVFQVGDGAISLIYTCKLFFVS